MIRYNPLIPTRAYIILESQDMLPKIVATKLKSKNPISPQLTAPMIVIVRVKHCKNLFSISHHPFIYIVFPLLCKICIKNTRKSFDKIFAYKASRGRSEAATEGEVSAQQ